MDGKWGSATPWILPWATHSHVTPSPLGRRLSPLPSQGHIWYHDGFYRKWSGWDNFMVSQPTSFPMSNC